jgi:hypothetical protein
MENDIIVLKHFIEENNIQAAVDKEKEIELKYDKERNKEIYEKNTEVIIQFIKNE